MNAAKCVYKALCVENDASTCKEKGKGRLKGKARKVAAVAVAVAPTGPEYKIRVSDYIPMAYAFTEASGLESIPRALARIFGRII